MRNLLPCSALVVGTIFLSGCFVAENDDANPIIPVASLAYPLKTGPGKQCTQSNGDLECARVEIVKLPDGGYELRSWNVDAGPDEEPATESYRMRALKGAGVPANTFLVQSISPDAEQRTLGLMMRHPEGGWLRVSPQCENLRPDTFVTYMTEGWIKSNSEQIADMRCEIRRDGLTDDRIYQILDAGNKAGEPTLLYDGQKS